MKAVRFLKERKKLLVSLLKENHTTFLFNELNLIDTVLALLTEEHTSEVAKETIENTKHVVNPPSLPEKVDVVFNPSSGFFSINGKEYFIYCKEYGPYTNRYIYSAYDNSVEWRHVNESPRDGTVVLVKAINTSMPKLIAYVGKAAYTYYHTATGGSFNWLKENRKIVPGKVIGWRPVEE